MHCRRKKPFDSETEENRLIMTSKELNSKDKVESWVRTLQELVKWAKDKDNDLSE